MPGPLAHLTYGLSTGLALRTVSEGKFTDTHMLVYAVNCFFGPDMGAFTEFVTRQVSGDDRIGGAVMHFVHNAFLYPLCVAPMVAFLWSYFITFRVVCDPAAVVLKRRYHIVRVRGDLRWIQLWALCVAGGLSHFFLDTVFEMNGRDPLYLWILSTGYWDNAYLDPIGMITIGCLTVILLVGFLLINAQVAPGLPSGLQPISTALEHHKVHRTGHLLLFVVCAYLFYLWLRLYAIGGPRVPAAGEEADLGVLVFLLYFMCLPLYLLAASCNESAPGHGQASS